MPVKHEVWAFVREHETPHAPQSFTVVISVSQPLVGSPSQSDQPCAQDGRHTPKEHAVVPLGLVQLMLHPPQLLVSHSIFVSQPLESMLSQF